MEAGFSISYKPVEMILTLLSCTKIKKKNKDKNKNKNKKQLLTTSGIACWMVNGAGPDQTVEHLNLGLHSLLRYTCPNTVKAVLN